MSRRQMVDMNDQPDISDEELMSLITRRDSAAFEHLYDRYAPVILGTVVKIVQNRAEGEEILQEAFWRVWNQAETFDADKGSFRSWVFSIARRLALDLLRRRATRGGKRIDLTAKEFALLELLLRRHGEVLPRSLIASQVWDMNFDSDTNVIEVAVRRLRAKVDDAFEPKLIRTVRGMGYVLEAAEPAPR